MLFLTTCFDTKDNFFFSWHSLVWATTECEYIFFNLVLWILLLPRGKWRCKTNAKYTNNTTTQSNWTKIDLPSAKHRGELCPHQNLPSGTTEEGKQTFFPHPSKTITWGFGRKWVNSQWNLQILLLNPLGVLKRSLLCLILSLSLAHLACKSKNNEELSWKVTGKQSFPQNYEGNKPCQVLNKVLL